MASFHRTLPGFLVTLGFTYMLCSTVKVKSARHCSELHSDPPPPKLHLHPNLRYLDVPLFVKRSLQMQ